MNAITSDTPGQLFMAFANANRRTEQTATCPLDSLFEDFYAKFIIPCAEWATAGNIPKAPPRTVFYPFAGPDILFPLAMFPDARNFILVGRERWGQATPDVSAFSVDSITETLRHYLHTSFFVTADLDADLHRYSLPGIVPLLLTQLIRTGYSIHAVETTANGSGGSISFGSPDDPFRLQYFCQDMRDEYLSPETDLMRCLAEDSFITLVKSASYLLHEPNFSQLTQFIITRTSLLVQDPSGLPFELLAKNGWSTALHGCFVRDIPLFAQKYDQADLRAAYQASGPKQSLPFGFGYLKIPESAAIIVGTPKG